MIHPTIRIVAAARRDGCPDKVAPAVAAAVLRVAASEIEEPKAAEELRHWAEDLEEQ